MGMPEQQEEAVNDICAGLAGEDRQRIVSSGLSQHEKDWIAETAILHGCIGDQVILEEMVIARCRRGPK